MHYRGIRTKFTFVLLLYGLSPFTANAEDIYLELVVSPNRWGTTLPSVPDKVTSITDQQIEKLPARDAAEALEYTPGVVIDRSGGVGSVTFPSVQGAEYYETSIMINGIPMNDLANGIGNIGQIPSEQVKRIEVIHGAGGVQWGSALGGVINIITHRAQPNAPSRILVGGGDYASRFGSATVQQTSGPVSIALGGGFRRSEGPEGERRQNTQYNVIGSASVDWADNRSLYLQGYNFQGSTGSGEFHATPSFPSLQGYWEKYVYNTSGIGATGNVSSGNHSFQLTGYAQRQEQATLQNNIATGYLGEVRLKDEIYGGSFIYHSTVMQETELTIGVDNKSGQLNSSSLVKDRYTTVSNGVFANLQRHLSRFVLNAGARHSEEELYGSFDGFNLGAAYLGELMNIKASVSRGYTAPPLAFRFAEVAGYFAPNPDLTTEKVTAGNLGIRTNPAMPVILDLNFFHAQTSDALDITTNSAGLSTYKNFKKYTRQGVEAELKMNLMDGASIFANTFQQEIKDENGNIVPNKVKATYSNGVEYRTGTWSAMVTGTYKVINASVDRPAKDQQWLLNAKFGCPLELLDYRLNLVASVYNLTDRETASNAMQPFSPPRQVELSIETSF